MATPISKLPKPALQDDDSEAGVELFENVMNQVDNEEAVGPNANVKAGVTGDSVSMNSTETCSNDNDRIIADAMRKNQQQKDMMSSLEADQQADRIIDNMISKEINQRPLIERIFDELKDPILIIILFIAFQNNFFKSILTKFGSTYLVTGENFNLLGMVTYAVLFGLMYYVIKKVLF